jgi:hypothetical protein
MIPGTTWDALPCPFECTIVVDAVGSRHLLIRTVRGMTHAVIFSGKGGLDVCTRPAVRP